jgi:hypothetical protein
VRHSTAHHAENEERSEDESCGECRHDVRVAVVGEATRAEHTVVRQPLDERIGKRRGRHGGHQAE